MMPRDKTIQQRTLAMLAATYLLVATAQAQLAPPEVEPAEAEVPRFTVEVIIFAYAEEVAVGNERFLPDATESRTDEILTGFPAPAPLQADLHPPRARVFRLLEADEYTLQNVVGQLDRLDAYDTLMHFGWTQTAYPEPESRPVELRVFGAPPPGLEGTFTLYLGRFLHLVVDLTLAAPDTADSGLDTRRPAANHGDARFGFDGGHGRRVMPVHYRIEEERIVKNGELRYFDHPKFGVLARVTRVDEEDAGDENSDSGMLLRRSGE